jgi:hypothetical protein
MQECKCSLFTLLSHRGYKGGVFLHFAFSPSDGPEPPLPAAGHLRKPTGTYGR